DNGDGTATLSGTPTVSGVFNVTITASNSSGPDATLPFTLTVNPTVSTIAAQALNTASGTTVTVPFTIAASVSQLTATSDNSTPPPPGAASSSLPGTGPNKPLALTPAAGQGGTANATVPLTDPSGLTATSTFALTVGQPPVLTTTAAALTAGSSDTVTL